MQVEVAAVQEKEIGDEEAAVEAYREAVALDPRSSEAVAALERLYTRLDRPADMLAIYERQLELTEDYREKVKILFHSAAIWEDRYQNAANADACIEGVLALDPHQPPGDQGAGAAAPGAGPVGGPGRGAGAAHPARHRRRGAGRHHGRGRRGPQDAPPPDRQGGRRVPGRARRLPGPHPGAPRPGHALRAERQLALRPGDAPPGGGGAGARSARRWRCSTGWGRSTRTC